MTKAAIILEFPEPLAPYSPMILLGFYEEKYMNRQEEDEAVADAFVAPINEADKLTEEVGKTPAEEAREIIAEGAGKDAAKDPLPRFDVLYFSLF